jgi:hypothetical protein
MPSIIQQAIGVSSASATLSGVTAGNVLVFLVSNAFGATQTVSGVSGGGTWTQVPGTYFRDAGTQFAGDVWICASATGGSTTATATWSDGTADHAWLLELTAGTVLDTAVTGAFFNLTTVTACSCSDAGALLLVDTVTSGGAGQTFQAPWTSDGNPNGNPLGHYSPGAAGSYAATVASSMGNSIGFGASFKAGGPAAPFITEHPSAKNVVLGATATFIVTARDTTSYQWQDNSSGSFADIGGATSSSYTTATTTSSFEHRQYRCVVTGAGGSTTSNAATLEISWHDVYLYIMPEDADPDDVRLRDPTIYVTGNILTITPSGGYVFSGTNTFIRTRAQIPSGGIVFSGAVPQLRERIQVPSGGYVFSGTVPLLRTRLQPVSGGYVFSGTAPITFTAGGAPVTYTITPSGGYVFSGTSSSYARERLQVVSGGIVFSGTVTPQRIKTQPASGGIVFSGAITTIKTRALVPSGLITFSGTAPLVRTKIVPVSGLITFSGSAPITFVPAGAPPAGSNDSRLNVKVSRAMGL